MTRLSIAQKQNGLYALGLLLSVLLSLAGYHLTQKKWVLFREAENRFRDKSFHEAVLLYQHSLARGETTDQAWLHLAAAYVSLGKFYEALPYYRLYLGRHPDQVQVRRQYARALIWTGRYAEGAEELRKTLAPPPDL